MCFSFFFIIHFFLVNFVQDYLFICFCLHSVRMPVCESECSGVASSSDGSTVLNEHSTSSTTMSYGGLRLQYVSSTLYIHQVNDLTEPSRAMSYILCDSCRCSVSRSNIDNLQKNCRLFIIQTINYDTLKCYYIR